MDLGLHVEPDRALTWQDQLAVVCHAEQSGFGSVWTSEAYGADCPTVVAWLSGQTTRIRLGMGAMQVPARSAAMTAMTAMTLDHLCEGRLEMGLGVSSSRVSEGWHGVAFSRPLDRTRAYVDLVRRTLAGEPIALAGDAHPPLQLGVKPRRPVMPIHLAAIGPKNITLAGEIADGWLPSFLAPEQVIGLRGLLEEGAEKGGRDLEGFQIVLAVYAAVGDDVESARDAVRPYLTLYVGGGGAPTANSYNRLMREQGFEAEAELIQRLYLDGRREDAARALPDPFIDSLALVGSLETVRERMRAFAVAGVTTLNAVVVAPTIEARVEQIELLAEAGRPIMNGGMC